MIKKIVLVAGLLISSISYSEITDSKFEFAPDLEYKEMASKMFNVELGEVRTDFIRESSFMGKKWYLLEEVGNRYYYGQKDPLTNKISRVRIVYPFSEFEAGRDIKHLTELYGNPTYLGDDAVFETKEVTIRMYIDKDVLVKNSPDNNVIIDMLSYKVSSEKKSSEDIIYKSNRMIRH